IYGKNTNHKTSFKESDDRVLGSTMISRWSYSCAKALDEFLAFAYYREKKLPVVIVRFFNICGPGQSGRYGMVIPRFVKQALLNQPMTIYGDGKQTRSFTHVSDAISAIMKLAENRKAVGEVFNLGNSKAVSINALAGKIKKMTESRSELLYIPYERAYEKGFEDMRHRRPNVEKLEKLIGFKSTYTIDGILKDTIKFFEG
ncbi:MAG: GDP-mannose 4,6-dehydratase, partial [Omnitrophica bacterium]|nr:GDP-mannose 4,6-dehydratase [Candidatus Omnitrophota bacterium]